MLTKDKWLIDKKKEDKDKRLTDSYITHDKFVFVNNVLKEYGDMNGTIKVWKTSVVYKTF